VADTLLSRVRLPLRVGGGMVWSGNWTAQAVSSLHTDVNTYVVIDDATSENAPAEVITSPLSRWWTLVH